MFHKKCDLNFLLLFFRGQIDLPQVILVLVAWAFEFRLLGSVAGRPNRLVIFLVHSKNRKTKNKVPSCYRISHQEFITRNLYFINRRYFGMFRYP